MSKQSLSLSCYFVSRTPWQPGNPVVIETPRLVLRSLTQADITPRTLAWHEDPAVTAHLWLPPVPPALYFRALLEARDEQKIFLLGIEHRRSGRLIGYVKLVVDPSGPWLNSTTVIGDKAFWEGKFGLETARGVMRFAFEHLPVEAIERRVYAENTSLLARYRRQGLEEVRSYDEADPSGGERVRQVHVFHQTRPLWLASAGRIDDELSQVPDVEVAWEPGAPVVLESRRLVVRTLAERDIGPRLTAWLADSRVSENVWHPSLPPEAFFRGLIRASDQKTHFSFALIHKSTGQLIGYAKLAIEHGVQVPTVVLGERSFTSGELGTEAVRTIQHFGFSHFPVEAVESRVYAENTLVRERLLSSGYEEARHYEERAPGARQARQVYVYRITREAWYARRDAVEARLAALPDVPQRR